MLKKFLPFVILSLILLIIYCPVYTISYAHHDSYAYLQWLPHSFELFAFHKFLIFLGRYVGAWILTFYGWLVSDISDLRFINLFTLMQCIACACLVMKLLCRRYETFISMCVTLMIFTLPPFQIMISYTTATSHVTAVLFSLWAAICAYSASNDGHKTKKMLGIAMAAFLLFIALCIYPSNAMFYWAVILVFLFLIEPEGYLQTLRNGWILAAGLIAIGCYALTIKVVSSFMGDYSFRQYSPVKINMDVGDRWEWFVHEPLTNAMQLWNVFPSDIDSNFIYGLFFILAALTLVNMLFRKQIEFKERLRRIVFFFVWAAGLIMLSFLPNLLALEKAPYYRCSAGLTTAIFIVFLVLARNALPVDFIKKRLKLLCVIGVVIASALCFHNVFYSRVLPSYLEFQYLKNSVFLSLDHKAAHIHILRPQWEDKNGRYDEFLTPSTHWAENIVPMVVAVFKEWGKERNWTMVAMPFDYTNGVVGFIFQDKGGHRVVRTIGVSSAVAGSEVPVKNNMSVIDLDWLINRSGLY